MSDAFHGVATLLQARTWPRSKLSARRASSPSLPASLSDDAESARGVGDGGGAVPAPSRGVGASASPSAAAGRIGGNGGDRCSRARAVSACAAAMARERSVADGGPGGATERRRADLGGERGRRSLARRDGSVYVVCALRGRSARLADASQRHHQSRSAMHATAAHAHLAGVRAGVVMPVRGDAASASAAAASAAS